MFKETFQGWKYGPVCPKVRSYFTVDGMCADNLKEISSKNAYIVKNVILQYGALAAWKLSQLSHKEISWQNAREGIETNCNGNRIIKLDDIKKDAEKVRPYDSVWDMYYDEFDNVEEE